ADRNRSHWSTSKTPSYTKSVSWQHHPFGESRLVSRGIRIAEWVYLQSIMSYKVIFCINEVKAYL
ncbi:hypothetical protein V5067_23785, partial [Enterobacter asburiae]